MNRLTVNMTVEIEGLKGVEDALTQAGPKLAKRALRKARDDRLGQLLTAQFHSESQNRRKVPNELIATSD